MSAAVSVSLRPAAPTAGAVLDIDLSAVGANTRRFAALTPALLAVVKADGYGLGATQIARTALSHGAIGLGVTSLAEALALRADGLTAPILSWLNPVDGDFAAGLAAGVHLAVGSIEHLDAVCRAARRTGRAASVHLAVDCGMARDGSPPLAWPALCARAGQAQQSGLVDVVGVMGQLSHAGRPRHAASQRGRAVFDWAVTTAAGHGLAPEHRHLATTAACLTDPRSRHTMSRVGAGLVGVDPSSTTLLAQVVTLRAPVVAVRDVVAGTGVGYGHTWRAKRATRLVTVPVGYADGIPRGAAGRAEVSVGGHRCPVVGGVNMDQTVIDVGRLEIELGEPVVVLGGEGPTLVEWAEWAQTLPHEILTGLGGRVARRYSGVSRDQR
ncbi:MAG: alanine racemase [Actinomycetales bacterium]|jgi:alanine racemase|uniref:Alanine racemase n=1 Tax=Candidatus Phosphoribacter hodrii TaxID=2953743 RepID=A0A9D7T7I7_9MICO|nr:alanine racemase [Candidatus Phosphoribacter hodrii]